MATTLLTAEEMLEETIRKVSSSPDEWLRFLNTASRVYQYSFDDQLMIYAQRPNAVGCTSFQTWKKTNHYVKQGTAGIALIHTVNGRKKLRYVYDYKDTGIVRGVPVTEVRKPYLWQIDEEDKKDVSDHLQRRYHIKGEEADLATMLKKLTEEIIEDTMAEEVPKLLRDRQDSYLEDLDQDTIRLEYRELFLSTAWYLLLSRCGIDPGEYMYLEDFRSITDFNNEDVLLRLGSPISEHCASILKEISLYLFQKNLQKNRAETIVEGRAKEYIDTVLNTPFLMEIHGVTYNDEKAAGEMLVQACTQMKKAHADAENIGSFLGFQMKISYSLFDNSFYVRLTREASFIVEVKKDPVRNIERILTAMRNLPGQKKTAEERLEDARQQLVQAKEEVQKPFEKEEELKFIQARLVKVNAELDVGSDEEKIQKDGKNRQEEQRICL